MCGRYKLSTPGDELWEHFDLHGEPVQLPLHFNIAPSQPIAAIRTPHQLEFLRWGLRLPSPKAGGINVRVESLAAPQYRDSIRRRRCLILADGFYEWSGEGKQKQPYLIRRVDRAPFAFAGLWADAEMPNGELIPAAAILTLAARGLPAKVHDRMPLILPERAYARWLNPNARYLELLEPDAAELELVAVSTLVNSQKNDVPACAEAVTIPTH